VCGVGVCLNANRCQLYPDERCKKKLNQAIAVSVHARRFYNNIENGTSGINTRD
jgi:hypothetical protein